MTQEYLRRTIRSIRGNASDEYRIIVACHDLPDIGTGPGRDLHLLPVSFAPEANALLGARDKARKLRFIGAWLRENLATGGAYVMFLDADDLVHKDLVSHVLDSDNRRSYVVEKGYLYDCRTGLLERRDRHFYGVCGSSFIVWFLREELPHSWDDMDCAYAQFGVYPQRGHQEYPAIAGELDKMADPIPFPAIAYTVNHGDNLRLKETGVELRELNPFHLVWPARVQDILLDDFSYHDAWTTGSRDARIATFARTMLDSSLRKIGRRIARELRR